MLHSVVVGRYFVDSCTAVLEGNSFFQGSEVEPLLKLHFEVLIVDAGTADDIVNV